MAGASGELPIVMDNGSGQIKIGFAAADQPNETFPSLVGTHRLYGMPTLKDKYYGHEAMSKIGILDLKSPIERGISTNWDHVENLWHHAIYDVMKIQPENHPMFITEVPFNPKCNREKMTQILFETFECPSLFVGTTSDLCLYASGRTTGLVVESGFGVTELAPIFERHCFKHAATRVDFGGSDLTEMLVNMLSERGYQFSKTQRIRDVNGMKRMLCYVAQDPNTEPEVLKHYELPDGQMITLGSERHRCPEVLFDNTFTTMFGKEAWGLQGLIHNTVQQCGIDVKGILYKNIIIAGGSTLFPGMSARLRKEVQAMTQLPVEVHEPPLRGNAAWQGASMLAALPSFRANFITKTEYDESGPAIVHRKCT
ncbi:hypothetical protein CAPTEDRAFT_224836 [Capitella teleta]|uniref:Uncharacterized protein n=1 Tax=Capitella teleta TaxID=283909 RepID=R7T5B0_CAPTE|nr:hypothetical protein CAPTEDRAFT_224836 [Capitella teleta]|eukprot:ELT88278.1 hypothetical protein CAPTEDRAFT_224836 [Capitella teleta]